MSPNQIKIMLKLVSLKKEATVKELADLTGLTKTQVKAYTKEHSLFKWDYVEPHGNKKAELYISLSDAGIEYATRYGMLRKLLTGK